MVLKTAFRIWLIGHLCFFVLDLIMSGPAVLLDEIVAIISSLFALPFFLLAAFIAKKLAFHPAISFIVMLASAIAITYTAFWYASDDDLGQMRSFIIIDSEYLHQLIAAIASTIIATALSYKQLAAFSKKHNK